jgi:ATP-dependent DNA helicase DinG
MNDKLNKYISPEAAEKLRVEIKASHGNEVFFVGYTEEDLVVYDVEAIARGHKTAVPAILEKARDADVVIHNHPSGGLTPSEADLNIATHLDTFRVSFYIVNNPVDDIYVVVEPFRKKEVVALDVDTLTGLFKPGGLIAKGLGGFENRPQQAEMIQAVAQSFNQDKIAAVEAGTGTGKTLAYLIPAVHWAVQNKERVVISTNTINLQEQLVKKDIPFLQSALPLQFTAELVKGRGNYLCLRKVHEVESELDLTDDEEREELHALLEWAKNTQDGSKADLAVIPMEMVWEKIGAESDTCTRSRCAYFRECFVNKARRNAARANLLVVNHHLLFADLAIRHEMGSAGDAAVLPPYERIILDEAHHIEDVATSYFGERVTRAGLQRMLSRLHRQQKAVLKGHLHSALHRLHRKSGVIPLDVAQKIDQLITGRLVSEVITLTEATQELMDHIYEQVKSLAVDSQSDEIKLRLIPEMAEAVRDKGLGPLIRDFIQSLYAFSDHLLILVKELDKAQKHADEDWSSLIIEIRAQAQRLAAAGQTIEDVIFQYDDENIRWIEIKPGYRARNIVRFLKSPLEIGPMMQKAVYESFGTVIMTSATLTVDGKFDFLAQRIGLASINENRFIPLILPAPFDYQKQALLCIPMDIPEPGNPAYNKELVKLIYRSLAISQGRAFVLFTSYSLMNIVHRQLEDSLRLLGINTLKQGQMSRHDLLNRFRQDKTSVLFGTDSFWEGVDVIGDALESVIISRLPFKVPNEPIIEARYEAIEKKGGNAFMDYAVPLAVLKFKQGFGRLIRHRTDRGSVIILDNRVVNKNYGKRFMRSLPSCKTVVGNRELVFKELSNFFETRP